MDHEHDADGNIVGSLGDLAIACGMAFLAGATDVYGVAILKDLFVSFMSGNTTMLGIALGQADWGRVGVIAGLVACFVVGAAAGAVIRVAAGRHHAVAVAVAVAAALWIPVLVPAVTIPAFAVAMGALNASMSRAGPASVSLTYVTGTLVKIGQGLGEALCGRPAGAAWLLQVPLWTSLLVGAVAAVFMRGHLGADALWPLPVLAAVSAAALAVRNLSKAGRAR